MDLIRIHLVLDSDSHMRGYQKPGNQTLPGSEDWPNTLIHEMEIIIDTSLINKELVENSLLS